MILNRLGGGKNSDVSTISIPANCVDQRDRTERTLRTKRLSVSLKQEATADSDSGCALVGKLDKMAGDGSNRG